MTWSIAYYTQSGTTPVAGTFIPVTALPGITAPELDDENVERKVALAISSKLVTVLAGNTVLALTGSRSSSATQTPDLFNQVFTFTATYEINHQSRQVKLLSTPENLVGQLQSGDIFPGLSLVQQEGNVPGAGILVPHNLVMAFGGTLGGGTYAPTDFRGWAVALMHSMINLLAESSAVVSRSVGQAVGVFPQANWTGPSAITGIPSTDLSKYSFFTKQYAIGFQIALDMASQTFDLAA